jgi:hypothetical protein
MSGNDLFTPHGRWTSDRTPISLGSTGSDRGLPPTWGLTPVG